MIKLVIESARLGIAMMRLKLTIGYMFGFERSDNSEMIIEIYY